VICGVEVYWQFVRAVWGCREMRRRRWSSSVSWLWGLRCGTYYMCPAKVYVHRLYTGPALCIAGERILLHRASPVYSLVQTDIQCVRRW